MLNNFKQTQQINFQDRITNKKTNLYEIQFNVYKVYHKIQIIICIRGA